jgi:hypothetical protein
MPDGQRCGELKRIKLPSQGALENSRMDFFRISSEGVYKTKVFWT